ncbi:MAG TPA: OmpA family protein [Polyangiaceae bacterium]|nr:OmpA family protein [Polyangiaceae bacterium]
MRRPCSLALAALAALAVRPARGADCSPSDGLSTCVDADNFWPHAGSADFASIGSTSLTAPSQASFGLLASLQSRPLVLSLPSPDPAGTEAVAIDNQLNAHFLWAVGLTRRVELSAVAPVTLFQDGTGPGVLQSQAPAPLVRTTFRDLRLGLAASLVSRRPALGARGLGLVARAQVTLPTGNEAIYAGSAGPAFAPTLTADYRLGRFLFGAEVGARLRKASTIGGARVGSQGFAALGVGFDVLPRELLSVHAEAFALPSFERQYEPVRDPGAPATRLVGGGPALAPAEWLATVRTAPALGGDFVAHAGGGTALPLAPDSVTQPRFRFVLGLRYAPVGRDSDADGIADRDDRCPERPEDRDGFEDQDGCPDPDNDRDGIEDARDRCRDKAEDRDNVRDDDGCPDDDDDQDGVPDVDDLCRDKAEDKDGFEDQDGCPDPDNDRDGLDDKADRCPGGAEDKDGFRDDDGCPDPDNDNDGLDDQADRCPNAPEDKDGVRDDDGCPDPDDDQDGVADAADKCPNAPETINGVADDDGCPEPGAPSLVALNGDRVEVRAPLRFGAGQAAVGPGLGRELRMAAQALRAVEGLERVVVETYPDRPGNDPQQEVLALRRAGAVRDALAAAGVPEALIAPAPGAMPAPRPANAPHVTIRFARRR